MRLSIDNFQHPFRTDTYIILESGIVAFGQQRCTKPTVNNPTSPDCHVIHQIHIPRSQILSYHKRKGLCLPANWDNSIDGCLSTGHSCKILQRIITIPSTLATFLDNPTLSQNRSKASHRTSSPSITVLPEFSFRCLIILTISFSTAGGDPTHSLHCFQCKQYVFTTYWNWKILWRRALKSFTHLAM